MRKYLKSWVRLAPTMYFICGWKGTNQQKRLTRIKFITSLLIEIVLHTNWQIFRVNPVRPTFINGGFFWIKQGKSGDYFASAKKEIRSIKLFAMNGKEHSTQPFFSPSSTKYYSINKKYWFILTFFPHHKRQPKKYSSIINGLSLHHPFSLFSLLRLFSKYISSLCSWTLCLVIHAFLHLYYLPRFPILHFIFIYTRVCHVYLCLSMI